MKDSEGRVASVKVEIGARCVFLFTRNYGLRVSSATGARFPTAIMRKEYRPEMRISLKRPGFGHAKLAKNGEISVRNTLSVRSCHSIVSEPDCEEIQGIMIAT